MCYFGFEASENWTISQALKLSVQLLLEPISVMGLGCQSWVWVRIGYHKRFSSQVLDFWLQKEPKVWFGLNFRLPMYVPISRILVRFGHQKNRFLLLDFGFYFWLHKTITRQCAYFISCRVGSWVILDGGMGCLDK